MLGGCPGEVVQPCLDVGRSSIPVVVSIFVQVDQSIPGNFRPVSLASCCFKVLEHLIHTRIAPLISRRADSAGVEMPLMTRWS